MARVTVEDCVDKVENRFELILVASHRARMISSGAKITVERDNDKIRSWRCAKSLKPPCHLATSRRTHS